MTSSTRCLPLVLLGLPLSVSSLPACGSDSSDGGGNGGPDGGANTGGSLPGSGGGMNAGGTSAGGSSAGGSSAGGSNAGGSSAGGSGAGGDGAGGSGAGGAGPRPPFVPNGQPMTAPDQQWTWIDFPGTQCRDGSATGVAVSLNSASDKVMIYLEGGGACFDALTCLANPANAAGQQGEKTGGLFARANAANPVRDWNFVYVPYCTGDVHVGTNENGPIPGLAPQRFVGRRNMEAFLHRIVPTFPNATQVLLTGISAGGFGAAANADFVQWAFDAVPVTLIDDSGPPMSSQYVPTCLQERWRTTWGLDGSILADCGGACPNPNDYLIDYAKYLAGSHPNQKAGLIETVGDSIITLFYGFGQNNCAGGGPLPAATFEAGLMDFRSQMDAFPNFGTYYIQGNQHTWLGGASLYSHTTGGVPLIDWVTDIIEGTAAADVGP